MPLIVGGRPIAEVMSPIPDKAAATTGRAYGPAPVDAFNASFLARVQESLKDRYTVIRELGHGASSLVVQARESGTSRDVALKVMRPDVSAAIDLHRFQREIEIVRGLSHPNVLPIIDSGVVEGSLYFTMPLAPDETLRARLAKQRQLRLEETIRVARAVASALDHAHAHGIVHRDVKPANILLDGETPIVADFGIARAITVASGDTVTASGISIGTPEYMSPEQGLADRHLGASTDIYALGCVVYEMLSGEPPFTGATAEAIVARHCKEDPRSLRIIRPAIPYGVERAVNKALAKAPADRFPTAAAFVDALEAGLEIVDEPPRWRRSLTPSRVVVSVAALIAITAAVALFGAQNDMPIRSNRVVVFPLFDPGAPSSSDAEAVATYIGNALANARPLTWVDGWELTGDTTPGQRLSRRAAAALARQHGARFFIDGVILRDRDSTRVSLTLVDALGDSAVASGTVAAPARAAILPVMGVNAVAKLLPSLVSPGGNLSLDAMSNRKPTAIANFLQGEREYRRLQFRPAVEHYEQALAEDSNFTLAAMRGAHAANWLSDVNTALKLANVAVRGAHTLSGPQALVVRGLRSLLQGNADSAIAYLNEALEADPTVHGAYTLLGETYLRLLPGAGPADSLARDALERARKEDADFAPTLLLLETMAMNAGRMREARTIAAEIRRAGADTSHAFTRRLVRECVEDGPKPIDFHAALRSNKNATIAAAKILDGGARQPECAIAAYTAIIDAADVEPGFRWAAFLGLQAQFAATGRFEDARAVFSWKGTENLPRRLGYLIVAASGSGFDVEASAVADTAHTQGYGRLSVTTLSMVGAWEAHRGNLGRLRDIDAVIQRKADSTGARRDRLLARGVGARLRLLQRDTSAAITILRDLVPSAPRSELPWVPAESMGGERLLLAELLLAREQYSQALAVASWLEAPEPVVYPLYLRKSLELRARAAEAMQQPASAAAYRRRLADLTRR
jgi:serine/threonine protein kinase/tetratricopeptide (TPR) repeat protein